VEMNRLDADDAGIGDHDLLELRTDTARIEVRAVVSDEIRRNVLVVAHGWGSPLFDPRTSTEVFRRGNDRNKLVSDLDLDPLSAAPERHASAPAPHRGADRWIKRKGSTWRIQDGCKAKWRLSPAARRASAKA
jgi:hypothetical protein